MGGFMNVLNGLRIVIATLVCLPFLIVESTALAWEPTKPIEFVIPAGTGGGADQMARLIAGISDKHKLAPRPFIVVNKSGGAGAEGFLHVKEKKGDGHTIIITLSNLFTTPLATGTPFSWRDFTPVARMALDRFILWVNEETPYKSAKEYLAAVKKKPGMKMGGFARAKPGREVYLCTIQRRRRGMHEFSRQPR
jgi:tripartite-type tricarboxylate transporter receptor subunit TctC